MIAIYRDISVNVNICKGQNKDILNCYIYMDLYILLKLVY